MFAATAFEHVMDTQVWEFTQNVSLYLGYPLTKYMLLTVLAGLLILLVYVPIARWSQSGAPPRGGWWNAFESLLTFLRDEVAKPAIGHEADYYVPFLWTIFLFILFCNLLGILPFMGSPTASISVTGALALIAFVFIHGSAVVKMGAKHYLMTYWPHLDIPFGLGYAVIPLIFGLEVFGAFIKAFVLAVRLFANIFAGHMVLAFILLFIEMVRNGGWALYWGVSLFSVLGITALSLLEIFVAFLQAYVFTFLTALFLGSALHPQH